MNLLDDQIMSTALVFSPQPLRVDGQRQDAGQHQIEQHAPVMKITFPKIRLFLDTPQPFQAQFLNGVWSSLNRTRLKIDRCPEMRAYWNSNAAVVPLQPELSLNGT